MAEPAQAPTLRGLRVLVVEDEALVAFQLEDMLADLGCARPASRVGQALDLLAQETVDAAVLNLNVAGELVYPVADALASKVCLTSSPPATARRASPPLSLPDLEALPANRPAPGHARQLDGGVVGNGSPVAHVKPRWARFALPTLRASAKEAEAEMREARGGTMADQSPEEIHLKHIRASDYKEIAADGTLHKIVDNHLVITFYIEEFAGDRRSSEARRPGPAHLPHRRGGGGEAAPRRGGGAGADQGHPRARRRRGRAPDAKPAGQGGEARQKVTKPIKFARA